MTGFCATHRPRRAARIATALGLVASSLVASSLVAGCSGGAGNQRELTNIATPVRDTTPRGRKQEPQREQPPPSGPSHELRLPQPMWSELPNGMKVASIESRALPIVEVRAVVLSGSASDGERPGTATLAAELVKSGGTNAMTGRAVLVKAESLGTELSVRTEPDRITFSLAVTKDLLGEALDLLGAVLQRPLMSEPELAKIRKRAIAAAEDSAKEDSAWAASIVLYRDLFSLPADRHPYALFDASAGELAKISAADCRAFHAKSFVPRNMFVVVAGDAPPADVRAAVQRAFGGYRGGEPPSLSFTDPVPPEARKITLVDRPKSIQSTVSIGVLGPGRADASWPAFTVVNHLLGHKGTGRLFRDVRETQGLAYSTTSVLIELANGPCVLYAVADMQTSKTGLAVKAMLDHMAQLADQAPSAEEIEMAAKSLADDLAVRMGTIGRIADEAASLRALGLPEDSSVTYRKALFDVTPAIAGKIAAEHLRSGHEVVVVAGDAEVIGPMLSRFGEVKVVDPTKDFHRVRTIAMNAGASLEPPRDQER